MDAIMMGVSKSVALIIIYNPSKNILRLFDGTQ